MADSCSYAWGDFWDSYNSIDDYARMTVCVIGCATNILNISILTRPKMRNPMNTIFTALAITDFLCVFRKAVDLSLWFYRENNEIEQLSYDKTVELLVNEVLFTIFHTWSIYLTLLVALWRYVGVLHPLQSRFWCTARNARWGIILAIGFSSLLVAPMFIGKEIRGRNVTENEDNLGLNEDEENFMGRGKNVTKNETEEADFETVGNFTTFIYERWQSDLGEELLLWIHGLFIKLIPCFILTFFSFALIWALVQARKANRQLHEETKRRSKSKTNLTCMSNANVSFHQVQVEDEKNPPLASSSHGQEKKQQDEFDRTTIMILVILIIFLVTEMPFGIYSILDVIFDSNHFRILCYEPIKAFFQLNEYISSSTSFFIYVCMSGRFRNEIIQIWRGVTKSRRQLEKRSESTGTPMLKTGKTSTSSVSSTQNL